MGKVIDDFINILVRDKKDNTYKFALARFLLDYIKNLDEIKDQHISYEQIAESFLKYYWNQVVVFKIKQDFKKTKKAKIVTIIEENTLDICEFYDSFSKKESSIKLKEELINNIYKYCLADVIPRFQRNSSQNIYFHNAISKKSRFYLPEKSKRFIVLKASAINQIKKNHTLLFNILILEWAKFLEKTNFTPRLIQKVERLSNPQRGSLTKYKKILLETTSKCFYCGKDLSIEDKIHVDHFIPWSYLFDDNLWNLVISCESCNLKKSNYLPSEKFLEKLKNVKNESNLIEEAYENCKKSGFLEINL